MLAQLIRSYSPPLACRVDVIRLDDGKGYTVCILVYDLFWLWLPEGAGRIESLFTLAVVAEVIEVFLLVIELC